MKLNFDFYISNNSEEVHIQEITEYINNCNPEKISNIRNNILNWYKFKEGAEILEIDADLGTLTELLSKKAEKLTAVCKSKVKAEFLGQEYNSLYNAEMYVGEISNIKVDMKFDYIVFYDLNHVRYLKDLLKKDGIAIMLVDNKFSASYFAGAKPERGNIFKTIMEDDEKTFSKNSILKTLKQYGFNTYNFYYPLPNYKFPNVIFSDAYMPKEYSTKLLYNIFYRDGSAVIFDELRTLKQLTKDGQFANFANSYLVEINNNENNQPKFISFNNNRKPQYRLMTKIYNDFVEKLPYMKEANQHIQNIEINSMNLKELGFNIIDEKVNNSIISRYINSETFDHTLVNYIMTGKAKEAFELIEKWYKELYIKLTLNNNNNTFNNNIRNCDLEKLKELTIIKDGYIDTVFENTFLENDKFILFDQEWCIKGIPIEFILFRAISNLYIYNKDINEIISEEEMLERFNLLPYLEIFREIEKYVQEEINDEDMKLFNQKSLNMLVDINLMSSLKSQIQDYRENDVKQNEYIKALEEDNRKKQEYINVLEKNKSKRFF